MKLSLNPNWNDKIKFRLDGSWEGEGIIKSGWFNICEVELTSDCKEWSSGAMIIINKDEITEILE